MNRARVILVTVLGLALAAAPAALAKTQVFLETSEAEFAQGHADGVVWTSLGTLRLGRAVDSLLGATEGVDYVARLAEGPDGSVYAVTGGAGRIYRIKDGKAALWVTLPDKFLFSCAVDTSGDLYVGSGGTKGKVWRVRPQPQGDPKAEVFFEADDLKYVWDLAWMKDGALAAATGDKGRIYRITRDKKSDVLIDSEADHILCLAVAPDGTLYAGTDGPAIVYRWDGKFKESVWPLRDAPVDSLKEESDWPLRDAHDRFPKKAFVLYDADEGEVTALALDAAGNLFVAASGGRHGDAGGAEMPSDVTLKMTAPAPWPRGEVKESPAPAPKNGPKDAPEPAAGAAGQPGPRYPAAKPPESPPPAPPAAAIPFEPAAGAAGYSGYPAASAAGSTSAARPSGGPRGTGVAVYRIAPDGIVTRVFEGRDATILALALADGRLVVGTGKSARVYEAGCQPDEEEACVAAIDPKQVMSLLATRDGRLMAGSAGPGRVYALSKGHAKEGTYVSQVYDAGGSARWGALDWRARTPDGTDLRIATRTGNVRDSEKGMWSEWSKDLTKPPSRIESPSARFIQFRVSMRGRGDGSTPVLEQYEAAYQRVNEAPRVTSVGERASQDQAARAQALDRFRQALKPPARTGGSGAPPPAPSAAPPPPPEGPQPVRIIQWQAADPNGDALRYDLYLRGQGEPTWILLEKDLAQTQYAWNTATVADGWYEIKVAASDRADNPAETALEASKISDPILVDNTAPVIEKVDVQVKAGGDVEVRFTARDAASRLTEAAYTVDSAGDWRPLSPTDGLFDGKQKEFRFTIPKLAAGPHRVAVRAADEAHNIGHAAQTVTVGK
jgi:hypothetical protein